MAPNDFHIGPDGDEPDEPDEADGADLIKGLDGSQLDGKHTPKILEPDKTTVLEPEEFFGRVFTPHPPRTDQQRMKIRADGELLEPESVTMEIDRPAPPIHHFADHDHEWMNKPNREYHVTAKFRACDQAVTSIEEAFRVQRHPVELVAEADNTTYVCEDFHVVSIHTGGFQIDHMPMVTVDLTHITDL